VGAEGPVSPNKCRRSWCKVQNLVIARNEKGLVVEGAELLQRPRCSKRVGLVEFTRYAQDFLDESSLLETSEVVVWWWRVQKTLVARK